MELERELPDAEGTDIGARQERSGARRLAKATVTVSVGAMRGMPLI